jgi:hypothetical protein
MLLVQPVRISTKRYFSPSDWGARDGDKFNYIITLPGNKTKSAYWLVYVVNFVLKFPSISTTLGKSLDRGI